MPAMLISRTLIQHPPQGDERRLGLARLRSVGKTPSATWTFPVVAFHKCRKGRWLRKSRDRSESQGRSVGIVPVGDASDRVAKNFYRRLWNVFIVICCTRFPEILQKPDLFFAGLDVCLGFDAGQIAELVKTIVWPRSSAIEHGIFGAGIVRH